MDILPRGFNSILRRVKKPAHILIALVGVILVLMARFGGNNPTALYFGLCIVVLSAIVLLHDLYEAYLKRKLSPETNPNSSSREKYKRVIASKDAQDFWKSFVQEELQLVTGHFTWKDSEQEGTRKDRVWEPAGLIGAGDATAIGELQSFFAAMGLSTFGVTYAGEGFQDRKQVRLQNLILLGASDYNAITAIAMDGIGSTLRFDEDIPDTQIGIYDNKSKDEPWVYSMESTSDTVTVTDYCVIIRTENPFWEGRQLLIVAGTSGYGTLAGTQFVLSLEFLEHPLVTSGKPCEFLIETEVVNGEVMTTKPIRKGGLGEVLELASTNGITSENEPSLPSHSETP